MAKNSEYRALIRVNPPNTQQALMCPYCLNRAQPRKSHKAATYKLYHTKKLLIPSCKTCGRKLIVPLTSQGIMTQELSINADGMTKNDGARK